MIKESVTVVNATGIHARPAAVLAKILKKYSSTFTIINNGKTVEIKGMMSILSAGIKGKSAIDIICDGDDESAMISELKLAFADGFGEVNEPA